MPFNTRRYLDVDSTFFERQMDVETTFCANWDWSNSLKLYLF